MKDSEPTFFDLLRCWLWLVCNWLFKRLREFWIHLTVDFDIVERVAIIILIGSSAYWIATSIFYHFK